MNKTKLWTEIEIINSKIKYANTIKKSVEKDIETFMKRKKQLEQKIDPEIEMTLDDMDFAD